jgi:hypothetical protein
MVEVDQGKPFINWSEFQKTWTPGEIRHY